MSAIIPIPRCPVTTRIAIASDLPFIDHLQKMHTHMVGWMPTKQIEGKIAAGNVLIAEDDQQNPLGYCISQDQYNGRDDVGIIYQLNVVPLQQRNLIGATLIKAVFERAAYGCRLFCLWCAQDIQANYFWEAIGFVPLAFRTGSRNKQRTHIFWQRRIREGDSGAGATPYWFPSQTKSGAIREDRIVLPIPPGTHWRDVLPILLPGMSQAEPEQKSLPPTRPPASGKPFTPKVAIASAPPAPKHLQVVPTGKAAVVTASGVRYLDRADHVPEPVPPKPKRERKPAAKNDPKLIAAARELRDRYLEEVNSGRFLPKEATKYDVSRALPGAAEPVVQRTVPMALPAPVAA